MLARTVLLLSSLLGVQALAQTSFVYQGRLMENGQAATGSYDIDFRLIDPFGAGNEVARFCRAGVPVSDGLFATTIDLGSFARNLTYAIRVSVRRDTGLGCGDEAGFVRLLPDQFVGSAPRANHALSASSLVSPDGSPAPALQVSDEGTLVALGNVQVNGSIGLGTTSPLARFDMRSDDSGFFRFLGTSADIHFDGGADGIFGFYNVDPTASGSTAFVNGGNTRLSIGNNGRVGINTNTPGKTLTVAGDMEIGTAAGDYRHLRVGGGNSSGFLYGSFARFGDGVHLGYNYYANAGGGNVVANTGGGTSRLSCGYGSIQLAVGGVNTAPSTLRLEADASGVSVFGTFNNSSDRNEKLGFAPIDPEGVLAKVLALPLSSWSYRADPQTRHLGPMAQDFHAAFGIGTDDRHISPLDEGGVAFAAIQGLHARFRQNHERLQAQIRERDVQISDLRAELAELRAGVEALRRAGSLQEK